MTDLAAVQVIEGDRLFTTREKDLGQVFQILKEAARAEADNRPGRKAAM